MICMGFILTSSVKSYILFIILFLSLFYCGSKVQGLCLLASANCPEHLEVRKIKVDRKLRLFCLGSDYTERLIS